MTQAEVGSYIRLLAWQWTKGSIPDDTTKVERIAGGSVSEDVIQKFEVCEDGLRRNRRMETIRTERLEYMESQRRKSKLGVEARKRKLLLPPGQPAGQPTDEPRVTLGLNPETKSGVLGEKSGVDGFATTNIIQVNATEEFTFEELPQNDPKTGNPVVNPRVNPRSTLTSTSTDVDVGSNSIMGGLSRQSLKEDALKVLDYLNERTGRKFRPSETNISLITSRLKEKDVTVDGIKKMIDRQNSRWSGTELEEYLRPETLFAPRKFGGYYDMREMPLPAKSTSPSAIQNQTGHASARDLRSALVILNQQIATHPANREFIGSAESPTKDQKDDLRRRREQASELEAKLATEIMNQDSR